MAELHVAARFCGPPGVANGGFASGSLAALLGGAAEITLRRPLPLDRPLPVRGHGDGTLVLEDGGVLLAEARPAKAAVEPLAVPAAVTPEEAEAAAGRSRYYDDPVFPGCFVCGPARPPGDGLRIFPGRVAGRGLWAAPWTPGETVAGADGRVGPEVVWAALDCPSGIAAAEAADLPAGTAAVLGRMAATAAVLGRMAATVGGLPRPGDRCRVVAWPLAGDGRKLHAGSALLGPGGEVLAAARTVWITVARRAVAAS